jgi:hypothetical protein
MVEQEGSIKSAEELLMFPNRSPVFRESHEIPDGGKFAHTLAMHTSAEGQKFSGTDGTAENETPQTPLDDAADLEVSGLEIP